MQTYIKYLLWIAFVVLPMRLPAQESEPDLSEIYSIYELAERDNNGALKRLREYIDNLNKDANYKIRAEAYKTLIGILYDASKPKEAAKVERELIDLAKSHHDNEMLGLALLSEVFELQEQGKFALALIKLKEIQAMLGPTRNAEVLMRLHVAFSSVHHAIGNFDKTLEHAYEAMRLADKLPRRQIQGKIYRLEAIARLYLDMRNPEKSLETANEALKLANQVNSPRIVASLYMTQAVALDHLGRHQESLEAYQTVIKVAHAAGLQIMEATAVANIADHYLRIKDYVKAEQVARETLELGKKLDDYYIQSMANANIGFALGGQKKMAQAIPYINDAKNYFSLTGSKSDIESLLAEIGAMYESAGMYKEALGVVREQQKLADELFRKDRARAVAVLQEQFNVEQKQKQIELLARENQVKDGELRNRRLQQIIMALTALVALLVGGVVYALYRRVRRANQQLREANQQLEFHAVRDPLTGLYNRRSFVDMMKNRSLSKAEERREEEKAHPDCLILMDVDHFKHINDHFGHAMGDAVLMEVAHRLRRTVRDTDMVLRWGGEEFLIYSPKSHAEQMTGLVERVLKAIGNEPVQVGNIHVPVTITAGFISLPFSGVPENECNWEKALQIADMALYLGKVNGRNRAYGVTRLLVDYPTALPVLDHDLSAAIREGMIEMAEVMGPSRAAANQTAG